jgi:phosphoribosylglycinamide formyltransferase 1
LDREVYDRQLIEGLKAHHVDLICLAGYMRILSGYFIREFPSRILNIHPSLLPAFPGLDAQHQALEHGVKVAGCTGQSWLRRRFLFWTMTPPIHCRRGF